eukprot:TRINITY_DN3837_c0_g1_i2.p1 TRINITY_DN3837_c0_g1~~TRINITY_DN3837_c0_g1_i2.p1  ORF type:complete len:606 (-),score=164.27 TRINITY_DN3837_c0_g1_i2:107-1924(-)
MLDLTCGTYVQMCSAGMNTFIVSLVFHKEVFGGTYAHFEALVHPEDRERVTKQVRAAVENGAPFWTEFRISCGKTVSSRAEMFNEDGSKAVPPTIKGGKLVGICFDITDRAHTEEEKVSALEKAEEYQRLRATDLENYKRELEEFVNTICHEIRNPLNGLKGSLEWLKETEVCLSNVLENSTGFTTYQKTQLGNALRILQDVVDTNKQCILHQISIVDDVLDLSKLDSGKFQLTHVPFEPASEIFSVTKMFRSTLAEKNLGLVVQMPSNNLVVKGDPARLRVILVNLIGNAIKFTLKGQISITMCYKLGNSSVNSPNASSPTYSPGALSPASITSSLSPAPYSSKSGNFAELNIVVEDTGLGMSEAQKQQLFQRFCQVGANRYSSYGGSGLGLVLSKILAKLMGGDIVVESELGKGTKFTVTVRCEQVTNQEKYAFEEYVALAAVEKEQMLREDSPTKKILIVEDNKTNQKVLEWILKKKGYDYDIASEGREALSKLKSSNYDLIFMDQYMPGIGGLEATRLIRQWEQEESTNNGSSNSSSSSNGFSSTRLKRIPIIGLSGSTSEASLKKAYEAGMDDYITKPFSKEEIWLKVAQWTNSARRPSM